jgi:hypothetical protein
MNRYNWDELTPLQIGKYAEYFAKMEFTLSKWDVYSPELDDKGIDMIIRRNATFFEAQIKSVRIEKTNYVFMSKSKFSPHKGLILCLAIFENENPPSLYLIPSEAWNQPDDLLADRNYDSGQSSEVEFGLRLSKKNMPLLEKFRFNQMIEALSATPDSVRVELATAAALLADDYSNDKELVAFSALDMEGFYEQG